MPAHVISMRDIRLNSKTKKNNTSNEIADETTDSTSSGKTQTNDDAEHVPTQTDEIELRSMWTQHPSENERQSCGCANQSDSNPYSGELD
jgi:hypothetical protein